MEALAAVALSTVAALSPLLEIAWPRPGLRYPTLERSFTYGRVSSGAALSIGGAPVPVDPDGAFLAMVPLSSGPLSLVYEARLGSVSVSSFVPVFVEPAPRETPAGGGLDPAWFEPAQALELEPGDWLAVRAKGPPGFSGTFRLGRLPPAPLVESSGALRGLYVGHLRLRPGDEGRELEVRFELRSGRERLRGAAPGRVTVRDGRLFELAVSSHPTTVLRPGPEGGYGLFLPPGVELVSTGRRGSLARLRLAPGHEGWAEQERLGWKPPGTPPARAVIGRSLRVETGAASSRLIVPTGAAVPFELRHEIEPLRLTVRFFGAIQRVDRAPVPSSDPIFSALRWRQESADVVALEIATKLAWGWGYQGGYDGQGRFVLELRRPPAIPAAGSALKGRRVALDPGHGPDTGAVGALGSTERELNLLLAQRAFALLRAEGAEPFLLRVSSEGPPLADRPALAWSSGGELLVSLHNNAMSVEEDPLASARGFLTLYYHPQSRPLAESVQKAFARRLPAYGLADEGVLWGDLHVCRATQMPAILTESAYVMLPRHERLLLTETGRDAIARAIVDGIRDYLEAERARLRPKRNKN